MKQKKNKDEHEINPQLESIGMGRDEMSIEKSEEESNHYNMMADLNLDDNSFEQINQQNEIVEIDSQQSDDKSDEGKMNVFEFNDDLGQQLDDRLIIQNPTENAKYNLVERPKYLLQFENKDSEQEFLFKISKQESRKTCFIMIVLCILNKLIVIGDQIETQEFSLSSQLMAMFPIFVFEILLIYKLSNPKKEQVLFWTISFIVYGVIVMSILLSLEFQYIG